MCQGLPQVAETNTPPMVDAAGAYLLYDEISPTVDPGVNRFQISQLVLVCTKAQSSRWVCFLLTGDKT